MAFTIEKLLLLKEFAGCKLVAGAAGKSHIIECVDTMEIPNIAPWIKKNELLLTTGYSIINRMDLLLELLDTLYRNDSAGLAIKTRFIGPLPQSVIDRANEYGLPLIEVPDDTPFIPLIHSIGNCIADEQHSQLLFSLSVSERFSAIQQSENFFRGASEILYSFLNTPVIIADFLLIPYSVYPEGSSVSFLKESDQAQALHQKLSVADNLSILPGEKNLPPLVVQKIDFKGILAGYLLLPFPSGVTPSLNENERILLSQATSALAVYLSDFGVWNSQRRQQDYTLYANLVKGDLKEENIIHHWISQYNWPPSPILLLTFNIFETGNHGNTLGALAFQIMRVIRSLLVNSGIECAIVRYEDTVRCLISAQPKDKLQPILTNILAKVQSDLGLQVTICVSTSLDSYTHLSSAHAEAFHTIRIAKKLGRHVVFTQDLIFELAILRGTDNSYLKSFVQETLGVLEEYDRRNNGNLMETLQELVNHMGVRTQTAKALYLHRNTLLYRIQRIKSLTGLDLSQSEDLYKVGIALLIRALLDEKD